MSGNPRGNRLKCAMRWFLSDRMHGMHWCSGRSFGPYPGLRRAWYAIDALYDTDYHAR